MMTRKQRRVRNIVADLRRWGNAATRRVLDGIQKHGVVFETFVQEDCGCPIAYASGFDPDRLGLPEFNLEKASDMAEQSRYKYMAVPGRKDYELGVTPPKTYSKRDFIDACKIVLRSE